MKTGDLLTDGQGRAWTVGQPLGRGTWGRSWIVRDEQGREAVLKEPLHASDLPPETANVDALLAASRACIAEQADWLDRAVMPLLPKLEGRVKIGDHTGYITPRYPTSLARKLEAGGPLDEALELCHKVVRKLVESGKAHGNLRPSNVLLTDRGDIVLTDAWTPAAQAASGRLAAALPDRETFRPPDARDGAPPTPAWDAWAVCAAIWQAAMSRPPSGDARRGARVPVPSRGLDKVDLATLKDRALARLGEPGAASNSRFRSRLADRLGSLLNRGLSAEREPSPPYRFESPQALEPRLAEIVALIAPEILDVGKLIAGGAVEGSFRGGEPVTFTVNVSCTPGIHDREDLAAGLQLVDLDSGEKRVPLGDTQVDMKTHPSGRLRFEFTLPDVPPGRYRLRVAFSVRDGGGSPRLSEAEFQVRPPPGWVPPPVEHGPQAIPMSPQVVQLAKPARSAAPEPAERPSAVDPRSSSSVEPRSSTGDPRSRGTDTSSPGAEIIDGMFPKPLAPPEDDPSSVPGYGARPLHSVRPQADPPSRTATSEMPRRPIMPAPRLVEVELDDTDDVSAIDADDLMDQGSSASEAPAPPRRPAPVAMVSGGQPALRLEPQRQVTPDVPGAPSILLRPQVGGPQVAPQARTSPTDPRAGFGVDPGSVPGPGRWEALPAEEDDMVVGSGLPGPRGGGGEDLPGLDGMDAPRGGSAGMALDRVLALVRSDSRIAVVGAIVAAALLILITMALVGAC